jgi:hypothetical protein
MVECNYSRPHVRYRRVLALEGIADNAASALTT